MPNASIKILLLVILLALAPPSGHRNRKGSRFSTAPCGAPRASTESHRSVSESFAAYMRTRRCEF